MASNDNAAKELLMETAGDHSLFNTDTDIDLKEVAEDINDAPSADIELESETTVSESAAPGSDRSTFLGRLLTNVPFLIAGLALSLIGLAATQILDSVRARSQNQKVSTVTEMRGNLQNVMSQARLAVTGDQAAFDTLKRSRDAFAQELDTLAQSESGLLDFKGADTARSAVEVGQVWRSTSTTIDQLLESEAGVVDVASSRTALDRLEGLLLARSDDVVKVLVSESADGTLIDLASSQRMLTQRIAKNFHRLTSGSGNGQVAASELQRDTEGFARNASRIRGVASPRVVQRLDQVDGIFGELRSAIDTTVSQSASWIGAQQSISSLGDRASELNKKVNRLEQVVSVTENRSGILKFLPWILGAFAAIFLLLFIRAQIIETKSRLRKSDAENRENQEAILNLLDDIGSVADGDLTVEAKVTDQMTGAIADSINFAIREMRDMVSRIKHSSTLVGKESEVSRRTADELMLATEQQVNTIAQTAGGVEKMAKEMRAMSMKARESSEVARGSTDVAKRGAESVRRTIRGMDDMREQIQATAKRIKRLGESSQQIAEVVGIIDDIADQTNILSLNASIQAAAAGDAGRGFAVVAEEVQRLAERSAAATRQIDSLVKTIQSDTNEAVASMENATREVVEGTQVADAAGQALNEIETVSIELSELINNMAAATQKHSEIATKVSNRMGAIRKSTEASALGNKETTESISRVAEMARQLQESVSGFRLPE